MTQAVLEATVFGGFARDRYRVRLCDFFELGSSVRYDAVVAGEVIEHVEDALGFLRQVHSVANAGAFIFITTCINAPEPDHIFLFRSVSHFESIVAEAGLRVKDKLVVPYTGVSLEEAERELLPINIAVVLEKD
jgi:cyclopropane fatty-acyl-phospholipid synthase-like methyltransferase